MPSYLFGNYLEKIIGVHFPGGRSGWVRAGCEAVISVVPIGWDIAYILLPKGSTAGLDLDKFRNEVEKNAKARHIHVRWVEDDIFGGYDPAMFKVAMQFVIMAIVARVSKSLAQIDVHRAVFGVRMSGTKSDAEDVLNIVGLSKFIRRAIVILDDGTVVEREYPKYVPDTTQEESGVEKSGGVSGTTDTASTNPRIETEKSRDKPISLDDIANIASLLENSNSVSEFLDKIQ